MLYQKRRFLLSTWVIAYTLFLQAMPLSPSLAQQEVIQRIPPTAFAGVLVQPKKILQHPGMELLPTELIKLFGEKELGMDLLELESIVFALDPPSDPQMRQPPTFAVIAKFAKPQDIGGNALLNLKKTKFDGVDGYLLEDEVGIAQIDSKTFVMASAAQISKILKTESNSSLLISLFNSDLESPIVTHVTIAPIRDLINQNLPETQSVPLPFQQLLELPKLIDSISYSGNFDNGGMERLKINAVDNEAAVRIVQITDNVLKIGKNFAMSWVANEVEMGDPQYQAALVQYAERIAGKLQTTWQPKVDGQALVYDMSGGGNLGTLGTSGVLIGMLLPAVQQAREAARRAQSMNNMKQFALAIHNYESVYRRFPAQYSVSKEGKPLLSWRVHVLPYMEQQQLYSQFHLDEPWDSEHNIQLVDKMPLFYSNPNVPATDGTTVYQVISGKDTMFEGDKKLVVAEVTDGTSNTAILLELNPENAVIWTQPADWELQTDDPFHGLGDLRPGGFNVGMADGSVRFFSTSIDPEVWAAICTRNGGEVIPYGALDN